jgi:hypothetical protein
MTRVRQLLQQKNPGNTGLRALSPLVDRGESRQAWTVARQTAEISTNFSTVVENLDAVPDIGEEDGIYHRHSPRDNPELTIMTQALR